MALARHQSHRFTALHRCAIASVLLLAPFAPAQSMPEQHTLRELSGTVTDGHEPIRGAIVELEAEGTHDIISYVTEADGHYHFKRLNSDQDYRVWVVFRKRHSKAHEISKYDDHAEKVINFHIETF